ncbi:MAG: type II 3-dehydroquinate dehydratase [Lachnospiraceae bacterium]|nr:type II 3-dehydroquinate dehydratase [Lachnospiraceae bacterium]
MEERSTAYEECADYIVDVDELSLDEVASLIKTCVEKRKKLRKLLVINGPNLNFLGIREKSVYGTQDYQYLLKLIAEKGKAAGADITVFQSNHEGGIIDRIQEAYFDGTEGIVINPGAYTHYSYAIRDALASIVVPKVEVHISDITQREEFRKISVTAPVCHRQIYGQGLDGYLQAIDFILETISEKTILSGK